MNRGCGAGCSVGGYYDREDDECGDRPVVALAGREAWPPHHFKPVCAKHAQDLPTSGFVVRPADEWDLAAHRLMRVLLLSEDLLE